MGTGVSMRRVVISLHGIRTRGRWQKEIAPILSETGFTPWPLDYGYFPAIALLSGGAVSRRVEWFLAEYTRIVENDGDDFPSVIAHSLGTLIVAKAMEKYDYLRFDRVIFCGSIVRRDFNWREVIRRGQLKRLRNEHGSLDIWARVARHLVPDAGDSGIYGFVSPPPEIENHEFRFHRHSDYFRRLHYEEHWIPFLSAGVTSESTLERSRRLLVQTQMEALGRRALLGHLYDDRESMAFLFPDVYVDPPILARKIPGRQHHHLDRWLEQHLSAGRNLLLIGEPGVGKTTACHYVYRKAADGFLSGRSTVVPLFVDSRWLDPTALGSVHALVRVIEEDIQDQSRKTRSSEVDPGAVFLCIDGIDEFRPFPTPAEIAEIAGAGALNGWNVVTCRRDYFEKYLSAESFNGGFYEILELKEWDPEVEVDRFILNYFAKTKEDRLRGEKDFRQFLTNHPNVAQLVKTPLTLTMLLFIWKYDQGGGIGGVASSADLYECFLGNYLAREVRRGTTALAEGTLAQLVEAASWHLWKEQARERRSVESVCRAICAGNGPDPTQLGLDQGFLSLLRLATLRVDGRLTRYVVSFVHDSVQEFLVSRVITGAFLRGIPDVKEVLRQEYNYEINVFVRENFWRLSSEEKRKVEEILIEIYLRCLGEDAADDQTIVVRNSASYYLGRLESPQARNFLEETYAKIAAGEIREHPMVIGTLVSSLILLDNFEIEHEYLLSLRDNSANDIRTRKFHLVYYGDSHEKGPVSYLSDVPRGGDDWPRTRRALLRRMRSAGEREVKLRGLDVVTFRRLCETRRYFRSTDEEMAAVNQALNGIESLPNEKRDFLREEVLRLKTILGISH